MMTTASARRRSREGTASSGSARSRSARAPSARRLRRRRLRPRVRRRAAAAAFDGALDGGAQPPDGVQRRMRRPARCLICAAVSSW